MKYSFYYLSNCDFVQKSIYQNWNSQFLDEMDLNFEWTETLCSVLSIIDIFPMFIVLPALDWLIDKTDRLCQLEQVNALLHCLCDQITIIRIKCIGYIIFDYIIYSNYSL